MMKFNSFKGVPYIGNNVPIWDSRFLFNRGLVVITLILEYLPKLIRHLRRLTNAKRIAKPDFSAI